MPDRGLLPIVLAHLGGLQLCGSQTGDFPQGERAQEQVLTLPMYPELSEEQVEEVVGGIKNFCRLGVNH